MPRREDHILEQLGHRTKSGASIFSRRKAAKITNLNDLSVGELAFARAYAATLKACGWSWRYISDTLNIQTGLVKAWADDKDFQEMVAKVADDVVGGALEHLRRNAVDFTEMLIDLAKRTTDDAVKLRAIEAGLDRVGLAKVNKSESKTTKDETHRHEHTMNSEFMERLEGLPLDTQQEVAKLAAQMDEILSSVPEGS